jgi:hypothetical protein
MFRPLGQSSPVAVSFRNHLQATDQPAMLVERAHQGMNGRCMTKRVVFETPNQTSQVAKFSVTSNERASPENGCVAGSTRVIAPAWLCLLSQFIDRSYSVSIAGLPLEPAGHIWRRECQSIPIERQSIFDFSRPKPTI